MLTVFLVLCIAVCDSVPVLKPLSWLPLPDGNSQLLPFLGTADRAAWDDKQEYLYVIGSKARTLHIVDLVNHSNPSIAFSKIFEDIPTAIAFCRNGQTELLVIGLSQEERLKVGHVEIYRPYQRVDQKLELKDTEAIESEPSAIKFDQYCLHFVVTCEGLPGNINNDMDDPVPHVDVFQPVADGWTRITRSFLSASGKDNARYVLKDSGIHGHTIDRDLEPSDLVIDGNQVYVTFHENNAIGHFDLLDMSVPSTIYGLGFKDWRNHDTDTSDEDISVKPDRVNMIRRNVRSLYQPKRLDIVHFNNQSYLLTANTGGIKTYTAQVEGIDYNETVRGRFFNETLLHASVDADTRAKLKDDTDLGRLHISKLKLETDGWDTTSQSFMHLTGYGGRSWAIWSSSGMTQMYESGDSLEYHASMNSRSVFNGDCSSATLSPLQELDTRSDDMGVEPSSISHGIFNGLNIVAIGSGRMGGIWLYSVREGEVPGIITGQFESYLRLGNINDSWENLHSGGSAGVQYISDLHIVNHHNHQMVIALGSQMGAVAVFEIVDE